MKVQFLQLTRLPSALLFLAILVIFGRYQAKADFYDLNFIPPNKEISLVEAIHHISEQYQVLFNYDRKIVSGVKVYYEAEQFSNVDEAITAVLKSTDLKYQIFNQRYVVLYKNDAEGIESLKEMIGHFQNIVSNSEDIVAERKRMKPSPVLATSLPRDLLGEMEISFSIEGTVTDQDGEPLIGVNIQVKGTTKGTSSDIEGYFNLEDIDENAVLVVSYIGYQTQEVEIAGKSNLSIILISDSQLLDEVVVVGYSVQKRASVTSAVSTINNEDLTKQVSQDLQQSIQGRLPGLTVIDQGASPGNENFILRVRGITTLSNNNPLVIVDGIEQKMTDINPNDIESITLLKDASSTAIYGSRASNGVLLIQTKRPEENKISIGYNGYYGLQRSNNNPVHMEMEDYMRLQNIAWKNSTGSPIYSEEEINEYLNATDRNKFPFPNIWAESVLHNAPQHSHSLVVNGGTDKIRSYISMRYRDQNSLISNKYLKSGSSIKEIRANTDFDISKSIKLSADINYRAKDRLAPINEGWNVFTHFLQRSQWTVPKYPDGTYGISTDGNNPLFWAEGNGGTEEWIDETIIGNFNGTWEIFKGLSLSLQYAQSIELFTSKTYANKFILHDYYNEDIITKEKSFNELWYGKNTTRESNINNILNYAFDYEKNVFNVLVGYSQIHNVYNSLGAYRRGFYNNSIQSLSQGANDDTKSNNGTDSEWGLRSYFGRLNYSYDNKYLLEINGRYDGSSRFIGKNKYSFFPSFSVGWRLSNEEFWEPFLNTINEFKIRSSFGESGNQAVGLYSYLASYDLNNYAFGGQLVPGYRQNILANEDLTWETTSQIDIGIDGQFFRNLLYLNVDYYHKMTRDILLNLPVPGTVGLSGSPRNAGRVDNKGWEIVLGISRDFNQISFNGNVNLNINNNEVIDLADTGPFITGGNETRFITAEGLPINSYYGYTTDGYFQTKEEIENYPTLRSGLEPGDVKIIDLNEDGLITADDMKYLGQSFPKYTFSSNLHFKYKNIGLDMFFQGVSGYNARLGGAIVEMGIWGGFTHELITDNYWTPENRDARFPRPLKFDLRNIVFADRDFQNGSYLRLKNIRLTYTFNENLTNYLKIVNRIEVYLASTNLLTFASLNEWDVDPETNPGGRTEAYPQTSLTTFGVNIKF